MKKGIHPEYKMTKITCVCGNVIETRSTVENISVEICSACHPFYTGKQKLVDTAGRIDRFNKRYGVKVIPAKKGSSGWTVFFVLNRHVLRADIFLSFVYICKIFRRFLSVYSLKLLRSVKRRGFPKKRF